MKRATAILAGGLLAAAIPAGTALGQSGHTLGLSGPAAATVGSPIVVQATGVNPTDTILPRYLNVYALPASVVPTCPATFQSALQIKDASRAQGADTVALAVPQTAGAAGAFSVSVAYTPAAAGAFILCGYTHDLVESYAVATLAVTASAATGGPQPPASGPSAKPRNTVKPKVARAGKRLTCRRGAWANAPTRYRYAWIVNGKRRAGAARATLAVTRAMRGTSVRCQVTAVNARGGTTALSPRFRVR